MRQLLKAKRERLTYANVMSTIAVFLALGGTSYAVARNSIGTPQLKNNSVTSSKVKDGALQRRDFSAAANPARGPRGAIGPPGTPGASPTIEAWRSFEFGVGWGPHPSPDHPPAGYRKDSDGVVHLRGVVTMTGGAPSFGQIIGTLPAGYRSRYRILVHVMTGETTAVGRLNITPNGQIVWVEGAAGETDFTSLNDVSFATDG